MIRCFIPFPLLYIRHLVRLKGSAGRDFGGSLTKFFYISVYFCSVSYDQASIALGGKVLEIDQLFVLFIYYLLV